VDLDEIVYGGDDTEDDLVFMLFNAVASTIPKWHSFKFLRWVQLLNRLVEFDEFCMEAVALNIVYCKLM
jgi:hypothetical protein